MINECVDAKFGCDLCFRHQIAANPPTLVIHRVASPTLKRQC